MKNLKYISFIIISVLFLSCTSEERFIDISKQKLKLYLSDSVNNDVNIYQYPDMILLQEAVLENNGIELNSPIKNINEFQGKLYFFSTGDDKMIVLDKEKDSVIKVHSFKEPTEPIDISFGNPTDALITFQSGSHTMLYDLKFDTIFKGIYFKNGKPRDITTSGHFAYVLIYGGAEVSIVDLRDFTIKESIDAKKYPILSGRTPDNEIIVISIDGIEDQEEGENEGAFTTIIDLNNHEVKAENKIEDALTKSTDVIPNDMVTTPLGFAFLTTNVGLLRIDTKRNGETFTLNQNIYSQIELNSEENTLMLLQHSNNSAKLLKVDNENAEVIEVYDLPINTNHFHLTFQ